MLFILVFKQDEIFKHLNLKCFILYFPWFRQPSEYPVPLKAKQVVKYFKALRASSLEVTNILMLVAAVANIERDKIEKKLVRHGQGAIKAYGLYPIENEEELRQRYLQFKTMYKDATQYGSERQSNTQAAVKAGIKNLAQSGWLLR